jgi:hypothetical protein
MTSHIPAMKKNLQSKSPFMKMNTKMARTFSGLMVSMLLFMISCQKDKSTTPTLADIETVAAASIDENIQDATFNEVFDDVAGIDDLSAGEDLGIYGLEGDGIFSGQAVDGNSGLTNEPSPRCFTVTVVPKERGVFPKTVTLDFGTGCELRGHLRKGKIITVYTGRLHVPGNKAVTSFENFSIDSFKIEGKHTLQNTTAPGGNQRSFTSTVENARITNMNSGKWVAWNSTRTIVQVEGNGTPFFPRDDIFNITGNRRSENSEGRSRSSEIIEPLVKKFTCKWIVKGTVKISLKETNGLLDFGDGTCDNKATITVGGASRTISLR